MSACFDLLLPGNGSKPFDLMHVRVESWLAIVTGKMRGVSASIQAAVDGRTFIWPEGD
jgi:hypothetical protein